MFGGLESLFGGLELLDRHMGWRPGPEHSEREPSGAAQRFARRKLHRLGYLSSPLAGDLRIGLSSLQEESGLPVTGRLGPPTWEALLELNCVRPLRDLARWRTSGDRALKRALAVRVAELRRDRPEPLRFSSEEPSWDELNQTLGELLGCPEESPDELILRAFDPERALNGALRRKRHKGGLSFSAQQEGLALEGEGAAALARLLEEDQSADGWVPAPARVESLEGRGEALWFGAEDSAASEDSVNKLGSEPEPAPAEDLDHAIASLASDSPGLLDRLQSTMDALQSGDDDFLWGPLARSQRWLGRLVPKNHRLRDWLHRASSGTDQEVQGATLRHMGRWLLRRGAAIVASIERASEVMGDWLRGRWDSEGVSVQSHIDGDTRIFVQRGADPAQLREAALALRARSAQLLQAGEVLGMALRVFSRAALALAASPTSWLVFAAGLLRDLGALAELAEPAVDPG